MSEALSQNTQALLLLTAPLMGVGGPGRGATTPDLLSHAEYNRLALSLHRAGAQPADLLASEAGVLLEGADHGFDEARLDRLLGRGFQLSAAVERWQTRAVWVMSRADAGYPKRLKTRLEQDAPVLLYGCGERELLNDGGLAVVGERKAEGALVDFTQSVGRLTARAGRTLITGGEPGICAVALRAALDEGGTAVMVLAGSLEDAAMKRELRSALLQERLVLVSTCDPRARPSADTAPPRDRILYALGDAALIASAQDSKGAVWTGAVEWLGAQRGLPVYLRASGATSRGLRALAGPGTSPWPDPEDATELDAVLSAGPPAGPAAPGQGELPFGDPDVD